MRLPPIEESDLNPAQRAVFDAIQASPRGSIGLIGPFGVWVRAPEVGGRIQSLGAAVRYETSLADNVREVAICTVGHFHRSKFEFAAHRKLAVAAGVDDSKLERLRCGDDPGFDGDENIAWRVARGLLTEHRLPDALYSEALTALGETPLIELVLTIGYYCLVSHTLNAFEIP
ncbi:MAG: carboxymuconolactone decarboxylase family protein, partial [Gammaproteobacteria bacterium]